MHRPRTARLRRRLTHRSGEVAMPYLTSDQLLALKDWQQQQSGRSVPTRITDESLRDMERQLARKKDEYRREIKQQNVETKVMVALGLAAGAGVILWALSKRETGPKLQQPPTP